MYQFFHFLFLAYILRPFCPYVLLYYSKRERVRVLSKCVIDFFPYFWLRTLSSYVCLVMCCTPFFWWFVFDSFLPFVAVNIKASELLMGVCVSECERVKVEVYVYVCVCLFSHTNDLKIAVHVLMAANVLCKTYHLCICVSVCMLELVCLAVILRRYLPL